MMSMEYRYKYLFLETRLFLLENYIKDFIHSIDEDYTSFEEYLENDDYYQMLKIKVDDIDESKEL